MGRAETGGAAAPRGTPSARSAGFTLVELLVSLAVLLVVFAVAADLLLESARILNYSTHRARDPVPTLAEEGLRRDLLSARDVVGGELLGIWTVQPLTLVTADGEVVAWRADGELLLEEWSEDAGETRSRPALSGVRGWRWRVLPGGLVEVEVTYERLGAAYLHRVTAPLSSLPGVRVERIGIVARPRGGGGLGGW